MGIELRPLGDDEDERREWWRVHSAAFLYHPREQDLLDELTVCPSEQFLGAFDDGQPVGTVNWYDLDLTVPGGVTVPIAGVANVTVAPTHRRQGIATRLMAMVHDQACAAGKVAAGLTASESQIYRRFGYGMATSFVEFDLDADRSAFHTEPDVGGRWRTPRQADAVGAMAEVWERQRLRRAGGVSRSEAWWKLVLGPSESWRGGGSLFCAVHEDDDGRPDAYAFWRYQPHIVQWVHRHTAFVLEVVAETPELEAATWRFLTELDLVATVSTRATPVDPALRHRLVEPRQLIVRGPIDGLWLAPLDVAPLLAARTYEVDGSLVLAVTEPTAGPTGTHRLEVVGGAATCVPTDAPVDLTLGADAVGAVVLGGVSVGALADAGRVVGSPEAVALADRMFRTPVAPFCGTFF